MLTEILFNMARRRRAAARRARTITKYVRSKGSNSSYKPVIDGLIAGAGGQIATNFGAGVYGHPGVTLAVGLIRKNNVLKVEGARELGAIIATMIPGIGGASNAGGGGSY